jgi:formamidopyrimidine-DNA glycosylase
MPELPEVETTARALRPDLLGRKIVGARGIDYPPLVEPLSPETFCRRITGRLILAVGRRAKFVLLHLDNGDILTIHMRMSGRLYVAPGADPPAPHVHAVLDLGDGRALHFRDPRKFGRMRLLTAAEYARLDAHLGPEPVENHLSLDDLASRLRARRRGRLKAILLDQRFVAGLGNIYVDETLFRAGLHPLRPAGSLSPEEIAHLHRAIQQVLAEAIAAEGTTLGDMIYLFGEGRSGQFAERLCVYGRVGQPCPTCGTPIERQSIAGRSSHFCPVCQRRELAGG